MTQSDLYYRTQLEVKVSIQPNQADGNIDEHIFNNLKASVEKKSIDNGIVIKVNRIISYNKGQIDQANTMGIAVTTVKYECFLCSPTKDLEIICKVTNIFKGYIICQNGPVVVAVLYNGIDTQKFEVVDSVVVNIGSKEPIKKEDFIKVSIVSINNNLGATTIVTIGKLLSMATKDEINSYKEDLLLIDEGIDDGQQELI